MIWHVVSDVHGNADALADAADGADALLVLGDLLDLVDYDDPEGGILGDLVGPEGSRAFARARSAGTPGEMRRVVAELWAGVEDPRRRVADAVRAQYDRLFATLADLAATVPVYLTPGNVDVPSLWPAPPPGLTVVDGGVVDIGGVRVGFVGGVPLPPGVGPRDGVFPAYMRPREDYDAAVAAVVDAARTDGSAPGHLDVLASHAPPEDAELAYDVVSRRRETSSPALRAAIEELRPRAAVFGHVHAPLAARRRIGVTECVNAGHFRRRAAPTVLRW